MEGYDARTYGDRYADVYDDWYGDVTDAAACADHLAELARRGRGPVLELGVGSGRLALPLAARGITVHGIDSSTTMLGRLRAKAGGRAVPVVAGDMARLPVRPDARYAVVFVAFNTFFNLATETLQRRCLAEVAERLGADGRVVIEAFVPRDDVELSTRSSVTPRHLAADEVVLSISEVDPTAQTITGQHVHITEQGIRLRPWHLRYATPDQLDAMAAGAGLVLEQRSAGWRGEPFTDESTVHVSRYRRGNVRDVRDDRPTTPR